MRMGSTLCITRLFIWIQYVALRFILPAFVKGIAVSLAAVGISWITVALLRQSKLIARVV